MELLAVILLFYASQYLLAMGEEVFEGAELAVLPCHYSGVIPEVNPSVIWSRHDLKPQTVHLRRKEDDFCGQNQRFSGRTSMKFDALASADFSLSLRNPRLYDSGNYICSISDGIAEITVTEVKLQVKASPESLTMTMKVLKGEESVLLPCQYGKELEEVVTVKWSRSDLNPNIVHKLGNYPSEQNQLYEGRTSMSPYALTSSDFSLTLKEPQLSDSGIYICSIIDDKEEIFLSDVQLHVRASEEFLTVTVEVYKGEESVVLPCQYSKVIEDLVTVKWGRSGLNPDTVHQRRERDDLRGQNQLFEGRTSMRPDALVSGNFSLTLKEPQLSDSGIYICSIIDEEEETRLLDIQLHVKEIFPTWAVVLLVLLVLLAVSGGLLFHFRHDLISVYKVEVDSGVESVLLPFKTTVRLSEYNTTVTWRNNRNRVVHSNCYKDYQQHKQFKGRTEMNINYKSRDFSLTLKNPTDRDSGTYSCTVYDYWSGKILAEKQVLLKVKVYKVEVNSGVKSVLLPFKTTVSLTEDNTTVTWRNNDGRMVASNRYKDDQQHRQYKNRTEMKKNYGSGDFSLTLKNPTVRDSGTYSCTVYDDKSGKIRPNKQVLLKVKVYKVEVDSGVESVLLPFKTPVSLTEEVTVTWRNNSGRVVDGYDWWYKNLQQHKQYEGRTEMKINVKSRDFSLTLKNPTVRDSGTYTCTVSYRQTGEILAMKQVLLKVKVYKVEVDSGVESVLLPFKATVLLSKDNTTVTWTDNPGRVVRKHNRRLGFLSEVQHQRYKNRTEMKTKFTPGNFSLTLKNPRHRDSGIYTCIVSRWGTILAMKQVLLKVKVYKVEVDSGVESVLLPFKTPVSLTGVVTVMWRNNSGRMVDCNYFKELQLRQYKYRTEMKKNYKSGDFSLTLKNPTVRDSGTYTCTICRKETILAKKQVLLKVKGEADSPIMAIDFGSGYSGYAFNLKPREEGGETQLKRWGKELGLDSPKTPTCILFDRHKRFLKFGYEAKTAYSNMRGREADNYYIFDNFKRNILDIYEPAPGRGVRNNEKIFFFSKSMTRLELFREVLRFLKDDALKTIKHHPAGGEISASDFTWVLTVPGSLKDLTKRLMTEAAVQAGLVGEDTKDKLVFALESAAALAWCLKPPPDGFITQNHSRTSQDQPPEPAGAGTSCNDPAGGPEPGETRVLLETQNQDQVAVHFKKEPEGTKVLLETRNPDRKQYLVVDCGDQTVRFISYEVLEGGALKKLDNDTVWDLGEEKFKEFLGEIFSDGVWREYEQIFPSEVQKMMFEFIRLKHLDEDVQISCPDKLRETAQREKDIETFFASVEGASWEDGVIKISRDKLRSFFDDSLQRITESLRYVLNRNSNIGFIVLVGGLAESQMLRQFITDQFGHQYKVLCPLRPQEAVLKGAVELGRNPELVQFDCFY
ncbi:uncharacterized protein V3H82_015102 isoform 3-T3 [Fundulus diaphanus]